jgi:serine/threonine-protein kinase
MVANDLGACEWFVWDLRRSALIDRGQLDQLVSEFLKRNPRAEAPALAEYLVQQGTLTPFQAERILGGKGAGLVLGPYVLLDAIGQGSMGQVFKASSKNDDGLYAVKVLPRRSMWNVRLARRQVRSFGQFSHPAVVPFVDVGTAGGLHYLSWPLADGQTLEAAVQQQGRMPAAQVAEVGAQVAQGMYSAHQNSIFHGLLKPSNVMLGSDGQARILDFGIGSLLVENDGESLVDTMSTANTLTSGLDCTSPESVMDPTNRTPAGDQYSLGCTLYFCLTGRVPFPEGSAVEKMMAHQTKEPPAIKEFAPDCPDGLVAVVSRLMAKKPEERFSGMDEVTEALEPYLPAGAGAAVETPPVSGSAQRLAGLPRGGSAVRPGTLPTGGSRPGTSLPPTTPTPTRPQPALPGRSVAGQPNPFAAPAAAPRPTPAAASFPQPAAPPRPVPGRSTVQSRAWPTAPAAAQPPAEEVTLTPAETPQNSHAARMSASWTTGTMPERKKPAFGLIGFIAAALTVAVLVFLAVKLLLPDVFNFGQ